MALNNQPESVSSVLKTFAILQALSSQKDIGVSELAQRLMMSKSTVYRFLQTMKTLGIVSQEGDSEHYSLTLKLFEMGAAALEYVDLVEIANAEMSNVATVSGEAVSLGIEDGDSFVYVHKLDASHSLGVQVRVGSRHSLVDAALGNVFLAEKSESETKRIWQETGGDDDTDFATLMIKLEAVRKKGYAFDREEHEVGVIALAVPVYDRFNKAVASLSVDMPTVRYSQDVCDRYKAALLQAAAAISSKLGCAKYPYQQAVA
ncbi:Transcriptional regulator KdgR, KDG operon repressor [Grimontia indica]|uniref:Transcriptional regulator KdgR, KDG operon repressor n=1 Tax=Grimontia indica TaxID=1056512 RepID=R1IQK1_9GAMM|nr:DNA-binding transcriptional regulator KdgR [Grimontia indica]EOD79757.1 Transcriptional regulator KdgR, KDG operon repressor [Grimontia indica]